MKRIRFLLLVILKTVCCELQRSTEVFEDFYSRPKYGISLETGVISDSLVETYINDNSTKDALKLVSPDHDALLCFIPRVQTVNVTGSEPVEIDAETKISMALENLAPLKSSCIVANTGWWTYEICHLSHVRQFHQEGGLLSAPETTTEFFLGRFDSTYRSKAKIVEGTRTIKGDSLSITIDSGTKCDVTGTPREVEIQYFCSPNSTPDRLASIREVSMCTYQAIIHTSRLCSIPGFFKKDLGEKEPIDCYKVLTDEDYDEHMKKKATETKKESKKITEKSSNNQKEASKTTLKDLEAMIKDLLLQQGTTGQEIRLSAEDGQQIPFKILYATEETNAKGTKSDKKRKKVKRSNTRAEL
ncbi:hypothetical protein MP638_006591 [Amoeboaphelidium occidentale]|nr:hypothetical protein MP638_006591 [Amoeboaphelidium occidentale]